MRKSTVVAPAEVHKSLQGLADSHVDEGACSVAGVGASTRSGSPAAQSMSVARDGLCESLPSRAELRMGQDNFSGSERAEAPMIGLESSPTGREDRGPHERRLARGSATEARAINFHLAWRVALHLASCVHCQRGGGEGRGQPPRRSAVSSGELTPDAKWAARRTRERQCSARKSTLLAPAEAEKSPQGLAD